jgi:hypothetical protein
MLALGPRGVSGSLIGDFPQLLQRLRRSGFFISEGLVKQLLERHGVRQKAK